MVVSQGNILSLTLFLVNFNSITHCLKPGVECSLYVERHLKLCLKKLQQWATDYRFRLSKTKTVCMHICLNGQIPVADETTYLGVIFDRIFSFKSHLKYVNKEGSLSP